MTENTLAAFSAAADLGADMWELDVHVSADGHPMICHDDDLARVFGVDGRISTMTFEGIRQQAPQVPHLDEVIALAGERGQALYIELKSTQAGSAVMDALIRTGFERAAIGSFSAEEVRRLADAGCPYPLSVLVPLGADPFELADRAGADIIHLCWEKGGESPQDLVTADLLTQAQGRELGIVLWHEERASVMQALRRLHVLGICTNTPELMAGFAPINALGIEIVCHRGINRLAPENTFAAARLAFDQGAHYLEIDVRESADGEIVVLHDPTLDRTTNGCGPVADWTLDELKRLDAGSWFSSFHAGERIPTLREILALVRAYDRRLYIENKCVPPDEVLAVVEEEGFLDRCFFWSPDDALQDELRARSQHARIKVNLGRYSSVAELRDHLNPAICELGVDDYSAARDELEAAGIVPMMQYFGDDPAVFDRIVDLRPRMLNLDRSDLLRAAALRRAGQ